jgi:hypothetical protein
MLGSAPVQCERSGVMARARRRQAASDQTPSTEFTCPECGRTFSRAAALGAHRKQAHGIAGSSRAASSNGNGASRSRRTSGSRGRSAAPAAARAPATSTGTGKSRTSRSRSSASPSRAAARHASSARPATPRRRRGARPAAPPRASTGVNRDALLQALFPSGIPAREEVIRSVNSWLDEAERLARLA